MLGSVGGQGATLLALPIIARIYGPESFGHLGIFAGFVATFAFVGSAGYQAAFFIVRTNGAKAQIIAISVISTLTISLVAPTIYFALLLDEHNGRAYFILVIVFVYLTTVLRSLSIVGQAYCIGSGDYIRASLCHLARSVAAIIAWLGIAYIFKPSELALYFGTFVGACAGFLPVATPLYLGVAKHIQSVTRQRLRFFACHFRRLPTLESPAMFLRQAGQHIPILLTGLLFGVAEAGIMTLVLQLAIRPAALVTYSMGNVLRRKYSKLIIGHDLQEARRVRKIGVQALLALAALSATMLIAVAPLLRALIGAEWHLLDLALAAAAPRLFTLIIVRPQLMLLSIERRHMTMLKIEILNFLVTIISIPFGAYLTQDFVLTIWTYSISTSFINLCYFAIIYFRYD